MKLTLVPRFSRFPKWFGGASQRLSLVLTLLCGLCLMVPSAPAAAPSPVATASESPLEIAVRAARWQLSQMDTTDYLRRWEHGVFWAGMTAVADTDGAPADIREAVLKMGRDTGWQPDNGSPMHADNQTITQAYLWMARNGAGEAARAPAIVIFERLLVEAPRGPLSAVVPGTPGRWSWCDALFMAPPAMFELSRQTGDLRYRDHALREWWATTDFLYDPVEKLYYRDRNFIERLDEQGNKIFWSRGNGWVFAGIARSLPLLDPDSPDAERMRTLFREMAGRLVELQKEDGYWAPSLLVPEGSSPETSGTGFFTYGLAWGINAGLLERERFEPAMRKGWAALLRALQPDGKLGYVQQIGAGPATVEKDHTQYYGVGALLMAAKEITQLDASKPVKR